MVPGETAQDTNIDLIPDVAVGRLPCRSEQEVKIMVQKIITYETTIFNQPWFNTMLVAAGDTYPESKTQIGPVLKVNIMEIVPLKT